MELDAAGEQHKLQLNEIEEIRNDVYESSRIYKDRTKDFHDKMIKQKDFVIDKKSFYLIHALSYF